MRLALFDLDHTLLSGDSDYEWTRFLVDRGVLDEPSFRRRNTVFLEQYQAGTLDIDEFLAFQLAPLAKAAPADLKAWRTDFIQTRILPLVRPEARALLEQHADDLCALVTATNAFITEPICRALGIPHLIATVAKIENGRFTGQPCGCPAFREGKVTRVTAWLETRGLWLGDFEKSWFYSDSFNDLPLLSFVSDPVAVNPDAALCAHAEKLGWPILNFGSTP